MKKKINKYKYHTKRVNIEEQIELSRSIQEPIIRWLIPDLHILYQRLLNEIIKK